MSDSRVNSLPIVIRFNVLKNTGFRHASRQVSFPMNEFDFQRVKEALRDSVIVAVGFVPHATAQPVIPNQLLVSL